MIWETKIVPAASATGACLKLTNTVTRDGRLVLTPSETTNWKARATSFSSAVNVGFALAGSFN